MFNSVKQAAVTDVMGGDARRDIRVHEHGMCSLVDVMPRLVPEGKTADSAIVQAARVSYGDGTKTPTEDRGLIRYLTRHRHCYHPSMQVLTAEGWKRWDECKYEETFLVPDPKTKTLAPERLPTECFDAEEEMVSFKNSRMSFSVTKDHRMWFKGKYRENFEIVRCQEMSKWGHFDQAAGYRLVPEDSPASPVGRLVGFTLGDGSWQGGGLSFHLRKPRKKAYLRQCLRDLGLTATESQSKTYADATVFYLGVSAVQQSGLTDYMEVGQRSSDKRIKSSVRVSDYGVVCGILDGLINSDGHVNEERGGRVEFSSSSKNLADSFETLACMSGYDAHHVDPESAELYKVYAYPPGRTTLESREKYFSTTYHSGKVYCATTSTSLLMVRGGPKEFGFVCGNTTPLEMVEFKFHHVMPIFIARQWIRHRTANVNEYSARYSVVKDLFYVPGVDDVRAQSASNKQHTEGNIDVLDAEMFVGMLDGWCKDSYAKYQVALESGVGREQARMVLPLNVYTEWYWKIDAHNLFHFLGLRMDKHAQKEIQDYANAMFALIQPIIPDAAQAFLDYRLNAVTLSALEVEAIRSSLPIATDNKREAAEWQEKKARLGLERLP